jgi:HAD superfamily hydrolase (TIGR01509 family)
MTLHGVLFDLGGTLLHYNAPNTTWEDTEKTGARGVYRRLRDEGYKLPPEDDALDAAWDHTVAFWSQVTNHYDPETLKLDRLLRSLAARWGVNTPLPDDLAAALALIYMRAVQAHVYPLDGAADTLRALRDRGLRIGLISNTLWPGSAHLEDLERHGLAPYIEHKIFSADVEAWKPHQAIFQLGLDALNLSPKETIFVGDALYHDIWGAQQAGLRAVWIEQERPWVPDGITVTPDATIHRLPELLDRVTGWE